MRDRRVGVRRAGVRARRVVALAALLLVSVFDTAAGQGDAPALAAAPPRAAGPPPDASRLPFAIGERLTYSVQMPSMGAAGKGVMSVSGPVDVRGVAVVLLSSNIKAGVGPFSGVGHTRSWLDIDRMAVLRFAKDERRPLSRHRERIEVFPETQRWTAANGGGGTSPTGAPLDELSFIYFIRTLPLTGDTVFEVSRHFDANRNPVGLRILGRDTVSTKAGVFQTVVVEMRVKDPHNYRGEGVIRIHLTDDECRLPVRIESTMPDVGKTVLKLESATRPDGQCVTPGR